jgi:hypothetical protein
MCGAQLILGYTIRKLIILSLQITLTVIGAEISNMKSTSGFTFYVGDTIFT